MTFFGRQQIPSWHEFDLMTSAYLVNLSGIFWQIMREKRTYVKDLLHDRFESKKGDMA
jgi:hypothetical protein